MSRRTLAMTGALLILLCACGTQAPQLSRSSSPAPPSSPTVSMPASPGLVVDTARLEAHLAALQEIADDHGGTRVAGTAGYDASVEFAADALREIGFEVTTPEVSFTGFRELPGATLTVGDRTFRAPDELHALIYSTGGDVRAPVTVLDGSGCAPEDFDGFAPGTIAMTVQGGCFRRQQALNAIDAHAAALIVGFPELGPAEILRPTLVDPAGMDIPVVSVTGDAVTAIEAAQGQDVSLTIETERQPATARNVIAQLGDGDAVVMLGGHLDSVFEGPGINDNGSGVAALLEIARGVADAGVPESGAIRIGLWAAEEFGTVGSRAYVEGLDEPVAAYLNLDMAGSPNGATLVYAEEAAVEGSAAITAAYEAWLSERGEPHERVDIGGSSDQFGFVQAGIPTGGLFAGASLSGSAAQPGAGGSGRAPDPCYHLACDVLDNVDIDRVALFAEATFAVAYTLLPD